MATDAPQYDLPDLRGRHRLTQTFPPADPQKERVEGSYIKLKASLPGREALPTGRTPVLKDGTLQSLTPGILGPSSPTKLEKNQIFFMRF